MNISNKEILIVCLWNGRQSEKRQGERLAPKREAEDRRHPCCFSVSVGTVLPRTSPPRFSLSRSREQEGNWLVTRTTPPPKDQPVGGGWRECRGGGGGARRRGVETKGK